MSTSKPHDLILFGATGVTGRQMCMHLLAHAPRSLRWAIAGRSAARLEALLGELAPPGDAPSIVIADSEDAASTRDMVRSTRVLLHAAGPYAVHGEACFRACIEHATDYLDIGGETYFLQRMIRTHHAAAERRGVKLVPVAGYEALPFDLATLLAVRALRQRFDAPCAEVKAVVTFQSHGPLSANAGLSGGSVGTIKNVLAFDDVGALNDPACLLPADVPADAIRRRNAIDYRPHFDPDVDAVTGPLFPAPFLNVPVVVRSAHLYEGAGEPYGPAFRYREATSLRSVTEWRGLQWLGASALGANYFGLSALLRFGPRPARRAVNRVLDLVAPAPGQGPSDASMESIDYRIDLFARSEKEDQVRGSVTGKGHPGYRSTATMAAESALALALDRDRLTPFSGILTPAAGLGLGVRDRLKTAGIELSID